MAGSESDLRQRTRKRLINTAQPRSYGHGRSGSHGMRMLHAGRGHTLRRDVGRRELEGYNIRLSIPI